MNFHDDRANTFLSKKTSKILLHFEDIVVVSDLSTLLKYSSENEKDEREEKKQLFQKLFIYQMIITIKPKNIETLQSRKLYKKPSSKI